MNLRCVRFPLWRLMVVIAIVACAIGTSLAFSGSFTAMNMITGWVGLYGIALLVIVARGVSPRNVARIARRVAIFGVPVAGLFGLLCFMASGYSGLIGGFALAVLMGGWWTLFFVGLFGEAAGV